MLEYEFWLLGPYYLIVLGIIPFLVFGFWLLVEKKTDEKDDPKLHQLLSHHEGSKTLLKLKEEYEKVVRFFTKLGSFLE